MLKILKKKKVWIPLLTLAVFTIGFFILRYNNGEEIPDYAYLMSDVNNDDVIDILDVVELVNIIMALPLSSNNLEGEK